MSEPPSNKLPWSEVVSCVSLSEKMRATSAKRFFENKRFASNKNQIKRSLIRRLTHAAFDVSFPIVDIGQRIAEELRENSDAKALSACVKKIEQLCEEGWRYTPTAEASIRFSCVDLDVQLQPDRIYCSMIAALPYYSYIHTIGRHHH
jgi:hypothetical protein